MWEIWAKSEAPEDEGAFVRYTRTPFGTRDQAKAWARQYIPNATIQIRKVGAIAIHASNADQATEAKP